MTGTVHTENQLPNGIAAVGEIVFSVNTTNQVIRDPGGNVVFQGPLTVKLVAGEATVTLPASDDDALEPTGFTYTAVEQLAHVDEENWRSVDFQLEDGQTVELADLAAEDEVAEDPSYGTSLNAAMTAIGQLRDITDPVFIEELRLAVIARIAQIVKNVKDFEAVGDGTTNDLAALQAAHDSLTDEGGVLWFPPGDYNVVATLVSGGRAIGLQIWKDNVTLDGPGRIVQASVGSGAGQSSVVVNGQAKASRTTPLDPATRDINQTLYALSGSYALGSKTLTLATPAQAANFAPGDDIFIRTGHFRADHYTEIANYDPDCEYNIVQSANAGTGVITLAWPTVKPYAQEYFDNDGMAPTSPDYSTSNQPALYGVSNLTALVVRNFTCKIPVENDLGGNYALYLNQAIHVRAHDYHVDSFGQGIIGGRCFRDFQFTGITCTRPPGGLQIGGNNFFAPSTGCSEGLVSDCVLTSDEVRKMHAHEGIPDYTVRNNVFRFKSHSSANAQLQDVTLGGGVSSFTLTAGAYSTGALSSTISAADLRTALRAASPDILAIGNSFRVTGNPGGPYRVNFGSGLDGDNYGPLMTAVGTGGTVTVAAVPGGQAIISAKSRPYRHTYEDNTFFGAWTDPGADVIQLARGGFGNVIRNNRIHTLPGRYLIRTDDNTGVEVYGNTFPSGTTAGKFSLGALTNLHDNINSPLDRNATITSAAAPSINCDVLDFYLISALATNITSVTVTGTPRNGQKLELAVVSDASPRTITWGSQFEPSGNTSLPGTLPASTRLDLLFKWRAETSKWRLVGMS